VGSYRVTIKASAAEELESIPLKKDRQRIARRIRALRTEPRPHGAERLDRRSRYRVRDGRYRKVYGIDDGAGSVLVVKVARRSNIRDLLSLPG
jgi:mRNA interferase RelE/StbE